MYTVFLSFVVLLTINDAFKGTLGRIIVHVSCSSLAVQATPLSGNVTI